MKYEIVFTDTARSHFLALDARRKSAIKSAIEAHLRHDPEKLSKSRIKRLRNVEHPEYRLRVDDYRVFFDIDGSTVVIIAILPKSQSDEWLTNFEITPAMTTAALNDIRENLPAYLKKAAEDDVVITDGGRPVGILRGFADDDAYQEYRTLNDPRFKQVVARSRREYREGKVTRIEDLD